MLPRLAAGAAQKGRYRRSLVPTSGSWTTISPDCVPSFLTAERSAALLRGARFVTAVQLVQALGGGWDPAQLPPLAQSSATP